MKVKELKKKASDRLDVSYIRQLGIQSYGDDNLYPQTLRQIVQASATGSECMERYADFIEGYGFRDVPFSEYVVNRRGDTVDDIHELVCKDVAMYNGFALHVNYNINGQIVELHHVPFENCRLLDEDSMGYVGKIAVHPDWSGKKIRDTKPLKVSKETIDYIDVFNPRKEVVLAQMEYSGGVEFYKGQILWVSGSGKNTYPLGRADRVATEMSTDEGLANVKYRNVRNNFFPAGIMVTRKAASFDKGDRFEDDDDFQEVIKQMQGDTNVSKILEVQIENDEEKPEFLEMHSKNYDKEFSVTDASVVERIYSAFGQEPWYCIRIGKVGFSGDILRDAFDYYNSIVTKHQRMIERVFDRVFGYWFEVANTSGDYSVKPLIYVSNAAVSDNVQ